MNKFLSLLLCFGILGCAGNEKKVAFYPGQDSNDKPMPQRNVNQISSCEEIVKEHFTNEVNIEHKYSSFIIGETVTCPLNESSLRAMKETNMDKNFDEFCIARYKALPKESGNGQLIGEQLSGYYVVFLATITEGKPEVFILNRNNSKISDTAFMLNLKYESKVGDLKEAYNWTINKKSFVGTTDYVRYSGRVPASPIGNKELTADCQLEKVHQEILTFDKQ